MSVTVYTKPSCPGCVQTKTYLKSKGVDFTEIDLSQDIDALNKIKEMGYRQAPVVFNGDDHWSGFNPSKLSAVAGA